MKKSHKIIASLAAVGALCVGTAAIAGPWHHDGQFRDGMPCAGYASQDYQAAGWEAVARLVTITPEQQGAWKAYVDARTALDMMPGVEFNKPAVDEQSRLERRAQVVRICLRRPQLPVRNSSRFSLPNRSTCSRALSSSMPATACIAATAARRASMASVPGAPAWTAFRGTPTAP